MERNWLVSAWSSNKFDGLLVVSGPNTPERAILMYSGASPRDSWASSGFSQNRTVENKPALRSNGQNRPEREGCVRELLFGAVIISLICSLCFINYVAETLKEDDGIIHRR